LRCATRKFSAHVVQLLQRVVEVALRAHHFGLELPLPLVVGVGQPARAAGGADAFALDRLDAVTGRLLRRGEILLPLLRFGNGGMACLSMGLL